MTRTLTRHVFDLGFALTTGGSRASGDLDAALHLIDEYLEQIERPGWQERVWLPEVLRLKAGC